MSDIEDEGEGVTEAEEPQTGEHANTPASKAPAPKGASKRSSVNAKTEETEGFIPKNQQLFLVEFLIDTVNLDPQGICEEILEGQTCVTLKFLNFQPMTMCEKDFDASKETGTDKIRFNSGKSLMFAFSEKQCQDPPPMMAELVVSKKCPEGSQVDKIDVGRIKICMAQLFQQVYDVAKFTPDKLPTSKSIKDCFMLIGRGKRTTGEVGVYVRLTCLGQNVVTEFQCGSNLKNDPILFKNREGKKVYQFTGAEKNDEEYEEEVKFKEGCGCLGPAPPQKNTGGQGDAEPSLSSKRKSIVGGTYTKGGRVVLDIPSRSSRCRGGQPVDGDKAAIKNKNYQLKQDNLVESKRIKDGVTISQLKTSPDQNCFVLKVGDKGQIPDRGKMVLEFRTPKQKILPKMLPPYHEDIGIQTDSPKKGKRKGKAKKK